MDWWRELAKGFINLAVLSVIVLVYGTLTNPQVKFIYGVIGFLLALVWGYTSYRLWRKGE